MKTYLNPEEIIEMEETATNTRDKLLIRVLFRLGCRVSEALAIGVEDIEFSSGVIMIKHLKHRIKYSCPVCKIALAASDKYCPNCGAEIAIAQRREMENRRQRIIPVDRETLELLFNYIKKYGPVIKNDKKLIFGINRHRAWQIIKECAERAGLPKLINPETGKVHNISPHKLRDAFAVMAVKVNDTGDGLRLLQEHLGHQSITTTMRYRKVSGEEQKQWYSKLWETKTGHN
ncbi:MAG: tyrosine-type recombinase/integrase [Dehalococcoidales bacterium]|nr:tyrosine-type recombinase/integrase [Dehalococcoidales bacterium]